MSSPAHARMTSDEFIAWTMSRPDEGRYELVAGEVVAMPPERSSHALIKFQVARRLAEAVEAAGLQCTVYPDGMAVEVDAETTYEPDALVRCGAPLADDAVKITDPVIVVEVLSPSTLRPRCRSQARRLFPPPFRPALSHRQDRKPEHHSP